MTTPLDELTVVMPYKWDRSIRAFVRATATKTYTFDGTQWQRVSSYDEHKHVSLVSAPVDDLATLAGLVEVAASNDAYVVRGALTDAAVAAVQTGEFLNRRKVAANKDDAPSLREVSRHWLMLDVDGWQAPAGLSLFDIDDHPLIIDALIRDVLDVPFHEATCWFQFSASCGLGSDSIIKVHLWFWLSSSEVNDRLRRYIMATMPGVDHAPCSAVQPHYVAPPRLIGGHDPLPARTGWRLGESDEATLPVLTPQQTALEHKAVTSYTNGVWTDPLQLIGDGAGRGRFYGPIRDAIWRYCATISRGGRRDDTRAISLIQRVIEHAPRAETRTDVSLYMSEVWLQKQIDQALHKIAARAA